jgi:hypothetical protein
LAAGTGTFNRSRNEKTSRIMNSMANRSGAFAKSAQTEDRAWELHYFGGIVKSGVVNIGVFVLKQALELRGPANSNFTLIDCELLVHDITSALTVTRSCGWFDSDRHVMAGDHVIARL